MTHENPRAAGSRNDGSSDRPTTVGLVGDPTGIDVASAPELGRAAAPVCPLLDLSRLGG